MVPSPITSRVMRVSQPRRSMIGASPAVFVISSSSLCIIYNLCQNATKAGESRTVTFAALLWKRGRKALSCGAVNAGFMIFLCRR